MKQDIVEYMTDSFIDFNGVERKIVACALSQTPEQDDEGYNLYVGWYNGDYIAEDDDFNPVYRVVTIGIAVCNPVDPYDEEVGKKTAYNKALHDPKCPTIYTKDKGVAGTTLIKAFLTQEINYTKENPERIIKGYNQKKKRFDKKEAIKKELNKLSENERFVVELIGKGLNIAKCSELAKKAKEADIAIHEE